MAGTNGNNDKILSVLDELKSMRKSLEDQGAKARIKITTKAEADSGSVKEATKELQQEADKNLVTVPVEVDDKQINKAVKDAIGKADIPKVKVEVDKKGLQDSFNSAAKSINLDKPIQSFEDLKSIMSEFEETYKKIQKGTLKRQEQKYLYRNIAFGDIISGEDYRDTVNWGVPSEEGLLDKEKAKLLEIYKLYKNIQSAVKNNKGFFKGEQYSVRDLEDLEGVFKTYAQAYYEMTVEIEEADKRLTNEIGFTSKMREEVESLESVTSKMTRQFKGYVQEVIEDSNAVKANNIAYKEEQNQLRASNDLLAERCELLRNKVLAEVENRSGKEAYRKVYDVLPFMYSEYDMYSEWGKTGFFGNVDVDVLKEVAQAFGFEIPQAIKKTGEYAKVIDDIFNRIRSIRSELDIEDNGFVSKMLFGPDGTIKSEEAMLDEIKQEAMALLKMLSQDNSLKTTEDYAKRMTEVFSKLSAAQSWGIIPYNKDVFGNTFEGNWLKDIYKTWREISSSPTANLSDDYMSMMGQAIELSQKLNSIKTLGEEKYLSLLEQERTISEEVSRLTKNTVKPLDAATLVTTEEEAQQGIEAFSKQKEEIDKTLESLRKFKTEGGDAVSMPGYEHIDRDISKLEELKDQIDSNIEAYKTYAIVQERNKAKAQLNIFEQAYEGTINKDVPKQIEREYDKLWENVSDGAIQGKEAIEKFEAKVKELGYRFDEVSQKWVSFGTESSSNERIVEEIHKEEQAHLDNAEAIEKENEAKEKSSNKKALTEQARYYRNKFNSGEISFDELESQTNRIITEMQALGESTNYVEREFNKLKDAANLGDIIDSAAKGAETVSKEAESFEENAKKAEKATDAKDEFNESNKQTQKEADKGSDKLDKEAESAENLSDALKKATKSSDLYWRNQTDKDDSISATRRVGFAQDEYINVGYDKKGNIQVAKALKTNYHALEAEVKKVDKAMIYLIADIDKLDRNGFDSSESVENLKILEKYVEALEKELYDYYQTAGYLPDAFQQGTFEYVRAETAEFERRNVRQKESIELTKAQKKAAEEDQKAQLKQANESASTDVKKQFKLEEWKKLQETIESNAILTAKFKQQLYGVLVLLNQAGNADGLQYYDLEVQRLTTDVNKEIEALRIADAEQKKSEKETAKQAKTDASMDVKKQLRFADWKELEKIVATDNILVQKFWSELKNARDILKDSWKPDELQYYDFVMQKLTKDIHEEVNALKAQKDAQDKANKAAAEAKAKADKEAVDAGARAEKEAKDNSDSLYEKRRLNLEEIYRLKKQAAKIDDTSLVGQSRIKELEDEVLDLKKKNADISQELVQSEGVQVDKEAELLSLAQKRNTELQGVERTSDAKRIDDLSKGVDGYLKKIKQINDGKYTQDFKDSFSGFSNVLNQIRKDLDKIDLSNLDPQDVDALVERFRNLKDSIEESLGEKGLSSNKAAAQSSLAKLRKSIEDIEARNSAMGSKFRKEFDNLKLEIDTAKSNEAVEKLKARIVELESELIAAGKTGKSAFQQLREAVNTANIQFIRRYFSLQDWIRYARQAITTINEIDYALVDLKKTSTMTSSELKDFYFDANDVAKKMGVTTKAIIEQAASWSRLGYSSKEASATMAELSSQFASISPGMGTEEAQTGLVSLMKAYEVSTDEVERKLMDNINVLGNKFAETNNDIIEGMKRAGATLSAIGTSVEDSFALFTGAQEIIQNAETVGTALKTLSLRIRGYDEETEELADDVINAVGKVADLTKVASNGYAGVSLWADAAQTQYRSLKDYLGDIAAIWDEIDAKSQTDLLNSLFGKRGASVGSSILKNFKQVEKALEEMENAEGAADAEMSIIEESIEYKLNTLKQTWVGILQKLIDNGTLGELIDALIKISETIGDIATGIGPIPTLIAAIGLPQIITHLDKIWDYLRKPVQYDKIISTSPGTMLFKDYQKAIAEGAYLGSDGMLHMTQETNGLIAALQHLVTPMGAVVTILGAITVAILAAVKANNELRKSAKNLSTQYTAAKDDISSYKTQISALQDTLKDSNVSYEDSKTARERLLGIQDELIEKYGKEAESINLITEAIEGEIGALDTLTDVQWQKTINEFNEQNLPGWDWLNRVFHQASNNVEVMLSDMENQIKMINFDAKDYDLAKEIADVFGGNLTPGSSAGSAIVSFNGNLDELHEKMLAIQTLARNKGASKATIDSINNVEKKMNDLLEQYEGFYRQYNLYERILKDADYEEAYTKMTSAYSNYRKALTEENKNAAEENKEIILNEFSDLWKQMYEDDGTISADEMGVFNTLKDLFPELQAEINKNVLILKIGIDGEEVSNELINAILSFGSEEALLNYKGGNATLDKYFDLIKITAEAAGVEIKDLIAAIKELKKLEGFDSRAAGRLANAFTEATGRGTVYDEKGIQVANREYTDVLENVLSDEDYQTALLFNDEHWKQVDEEMHKIQDSTEENIEEAKLYEMAVMRVADAWRKTHNEVEEVADATILESVEGMNARLSKQFESLEKAYQAVFTSDGFDKKGITNDIFKDVADNFVTEAKEIGVAEEDAKASAEAFIKAMTDPNVDATKAHKAFNELATSYFYAARGLKELNEETANTIKQNLTGWGVKNADEVVDSALEMQDLVNSFADFDENLENEYAKIHEWGLDKYADQIKNKTIQTKFGNVDMDKRAVITWSEELKETYKKELASWNYDPEIGSIDTVWGSSDPFNIGGEEIEIAYTPIVEIGDEAKFLGQKEVKDYIQSLLDEAAKNGSWSWDEILRLDREGWTTKVDSQGKEIGRQIGLSIIAGMGENAIDIGSLLHFSGASGAIQLAEKDIEDLKNVEAELADEGRKLEDVTQKDIEGWLKAGKVSEVAAGQLRLYAYAKALSNGTFMDESASISSLIQLCKIANLGVELISELNELEGLSGRASAAYANKQYEYGDALMAEYRNRLSQAQAKMQQAWNEKFELPEIDYGPAIKDAGGGGKDSADAYVEAYEKELQQLDDLKDQGLISEKEYLERLKALIDKYFKDRAKYAEKYAQEMQKYMDKMLEHYNSVISGVTTLLDRKITAANKGKDAAIKALQEEQKAAEEAYQAQIDGIQEEIDAIDDLIDAKNDEIDRLNDQIDAINEANEARDRSINLQKAEYELQRAMHQRTKLVCIYARGYSNIA